LKKEIFEELGLQCDVDKYIGCVDSLWREKDIIQQQIDHIFTIKGINKNTILESKEKHISFYWIDIEDMEKEKFGPRSSRDIVINLYNRVVRQPIIYVVFQN
jgi:hypothetical protein